MAGPAIERNPGEDFLHRLVAANRFGQIGQTPVDLAQRLPCVVEGSIDQLALQATPQTLLQLLSEVGGKTLERFATPGAVCSASTCSHDGRRLGGGISGRGGRGRVRKSCGRL